MIFFIRELRLTLFGVKDAHAASTFQGKFTTAFVKFFFMLYLSFLMIIAGRPPVVPSGRAWGLLITLYSSSRSESNCSSVKPGLSQLSLRKVQSMFSSVMRAFSFSGLLYTDLGLIFMIEGNASA